MARRNISDYSWPTWLDHVGADSVVNTFTSIIFIACGLVILMTNEPRPVVLSIGLLLVIIPSIVLKRYGTKLYREWLANHNTIQPPHTVAPKTRSGTTSTIDFIERVHGAG